MKLEYTDGCTCTSLNVDGKELNIDLDETERRNLAINILTKCNSEHVFRTVNEWCIPDSAWENNTEQEYIDKFNALDFDSKRKEAIRLFSESDQDLSQEVFISYLENEGKYTDLGRCNCCGDHICRYSINNFNLENISLNYDNGLDRWCNSCK